MKISRVDFKRYERKLVKPYMTVFGEFSVRQGYCLRITADNKISGYGEIAPLPGYLPSSSENVYTVLNDTYLSLLDEPVPKTKEQIQRAVDDLTGDPLIRFGFETALCDLAAALSKKSLAYWLAGENRERIPVNYLLDRGGDIDEQIDFVRQNRYRSVKMKIGLDDVSAEIKLVKSINERLGKLISLRLDANRAFNYVDAVLLLDGLSGCAIEYIEEPLVEYSEEAYRRLKQNTNLRLAVDESLGDEGVMDSLFQTGIFDTVIIKAARHGGLIPAFEFGRKAKKAGMEIVVTSLLESEVATVAQMHLAAALDLTTPCGLDTLRIFEKELPWPNGPDKGEYKLYQGKGIGAPATLWSWI